MPLVKQPDPVDRYLAWVTPDSPGAWTFEVQAWSDPVATWQHDAGIKIPAGIDVELMFTEGRLLLERVRGPADEADGRRQGRRRRDRRGGRHRAARPRPGWPSCEAADVDAGARRPPVRDLLTVAGPSRRTPTASAPSTAAGTSSSRAPRAPSRTRRPARSVRHVRDRGQAPRGRGRDGLRRHLPPADPPDRRGQPQGPQQHPHPRSRRHRVPWAIGSKDGGHDAIHPDLGTFADFDAFVARAGELGLEVALDLALQAAPDHPWVTSNPRVVHHPRRRHHRLRREPAEEVPGHLPGQLRQRPQRHLPRGPARSSGSG